MGGVEHLGRQLGLGKSLKVQCSQCGHGQHILRGDAVRIFGDMATRTEIERRLKCSICGKKRANVWI